MAMLLAVLVYGGFAAWSGYADVSAQLSSFSWGAFGAACVLAVGNYALRYLKWEYYLSVLKIRGVPKLDSLAIFLSGFVLTITPGKVGEVLKSLLLLRTHGVPVARTASIVVAERLTDTIGITLLILLGLTGLGFPGAGLWACVGGALVAVCLIVIMSRGLSEAVLGALGRMPGRAGRLAPRVRESWESLREMTRPKVLLLPAMLSVAAWALEGLALYVVVRGFSASMPAVSAVFVYSTATLAGAVLPVPGGLGVTEGALNGQLVVLGGMTAAAATAAMLLVRFATLWLAVAIGFVALAALRLRHPGLSSEPEEAQAASP
jgi:uncharacterized protein (TIRG00374 family)